MFVVIFESIMIFGQTLTNILSYVIGLGFSIIGDVLLREFQNTKNRGQ